eukprot:TRINITY_DN4662_c0_g1_i1.p1 TRINITY_DN4662_c0_g1~~TRINITY_DN4662_c0_g1_i1.p1  ORF type:complete len:510 (+),score=103.43 TRINITY_DN4662_c0_g1_i1:35-1564(+)
MAGSCLILLFVCVAAIYCQCPRYPKPVAFNVANSSVIQASLSQLDDYLKGVFQQEKFPGMMAVVVYDQETVWSKGYGSFNPFESSSPPLSPSNVVRIASITKTFTTMMLYQLRDAGKVSLDDPVVKYLPNFSIKNPDPTNRPITLRELASHTAGMPRETPPCDVYTVDNVLKVLSRMYVIHPPFVRPHYSNLGMAILGRAIEKATGGTYEAYVEENILPYIGMKLSGFNYTKLAPYVAVGTTTLNNGSHVPAPIDKDGFGAPSGGLFASGMDMGRYMSMLFRTSAKQGSSQPLDGHTIMELLGPALLTRDGRAAFGYPWEYMYDTKNSIYVRSKAGELPGYRSQVAIIPELKIGIFISVTLDDTPDNTVYTFPSLSDILAPAFMQQLWSVQPPLPLPANWKALVGLYRADPKDPSDGFQVYLKDNSYLMASNVNNNQAFSHVNVTEQIDDTTFRINLVDGLDTLSCRWLDDGQDQEFIYFDMNAKGDEAASVIFMGELYLFVSKNCPNC